MVRDIFSIPDISAWVLLSGTKLLALVQFASPRHAPTNCRQVLEAHFSFSFACTSCRDNQVLAHKCQLSSFGTCPLQHRVAVASSLRTEGARNNNALSWSTFAKFLHISANCRPSASALQHCAAVASSLSSALVLALQCQLSYFGTGRGCAWINDDFLHSTFAGNRASFRVHC